MSQSSPNDLSPDRIHWWREQELLFVLFIAVATLCLRLEALPLFGEEPRRALIAREMVETGDWLVPCTQRLFLRSRPPLQNWMIAVAGFAFGSIDIWATRLPSILSTIAAAVMIYGYLRQQNSPLGSMAGAISFLTMLLVMEFGRSGETEAVFTIFVAASLFLWHWGWIKKWPAWQMWSVGYSFAALGMLTKGLQAPVYFVGSIGLFLVVTGNWRAILTRGHLMGMLAFCVVFGLWQVPFTLVRGVEDSWMIFFGDVAGRFVDNRWSKFLGHLVSYPCELLFVRMMPWSILLLAYGSPQVRARLGQRRETVIFLTISILFSFIFVWLPPGSKVRYYMPLFPSFAALVGIAVECLVTETNQVEPNGLWQKFVRVHAWIMAGTAIVVLVASLIVPWSLISLPLLAALAFFAVAAGLALLTMWSLKDRSRRSIAREIGLIAGFLALVQVGLITTVQERRCLDVEGQVEEAKKLLPPDVHLISLGRMHHAFAFFYRKPIPMIDYPDKDPPADMDYFCIHTYESEDPGLPFEWTPIAVVNCDRFKNERVIRDRVFVGRLGPAKPIMPKKTESAGD